ncbi:ATP phosphoribosyltransferase regulatory subunit [Romeria aff. gracilis LEGE 07310]|uniref:ATP phosphoribosyltransferase regulatory subunit n=1 Tax=Vasconcelosia minhoensis LEGE 07310 TaxID=915328 RepID=A0A8J7A435_9CYAN|nr:ATP phosphoribosyltransferase regulatory subunit [Romeria gracilis]MBE9075782.1 ATP phosphoribosyltransferase regulatory subunit [Romeria aff. gracilis LEGE 07310]
MIYQPPAGGRDLLPHDVAQKRWIEDRLEQVFQRWGYHRIITSTVETMETLMAGGAIEQSEVIELQRFQGGRLGLRPELTASIARTAVTRLAAVTYPQRLYYSANVFQHTETSSHGGQQEYYQAGVELLGADGLTADAEVLLLLTDCLRGLNLTDTHIVLGEAALTYSLLSAFPETLRQQVRHAIATLDRVTLEALPLSESLQKRALRLMDLRGQPQAVLRSLQAFDLDLDQQAIVSHLKGLVELFETVEQAPALILDLSLIRTYDYYTGIVFEVVGQRRILGQGGRYDHLLGVYHPQGESSPGIGFILNVEALHQVLLPSGQLPTETPPSDWLVVATQTDAIAAALAYAQTIRQSANLVRVELHLDPETPPPTVREIAQKRRIGRIAWIAAQGLPEIEALG